MKLTEFNNSISVTTKKALKEHYDINLPLNKMGLVETREMLKKVRSLVKEAKSSEVYHSREKNPTYMKLVFMEQALESHYGHLKAIPAYNPKIVVENEKVEESQVILAANELLETIEKMIEDVGQMQVKEVPAIVKGVENERGTNEAEQYSTQMDQALEALAEALKQAQTAIKAANSVVNGEAAGEMEMPGEEMAPPEGEMEVAPETAMGEEGEELPPEPEAEEEPEEVPAGAGRALR